MTFWANLSSPIISTLPSRDVPLVKSMIFLKPVKLVASIFIIAFSPRVRVSALRIDWPSIKIVPLLVIVFA